MRTPKCAPEFPACRRESAVDKPVDKWARNLLASCVQPVHKCALPHIYVLFMLLRHRAGQVTVAPASLPLPAGHGQSSLSLCINLWASAA